MAKRKTKAEREAEAKLLEEEAQQETVETQDPVQQGTEDKSVEQQEVVETQAPETIEEPKIKEKKTPEIKKEASSKPGFNTLIDGVKDDAELKFLAASLKRYVDTVYGKHSKDPQMVASMNYELYRVITGVLSEANYNVFKKKFDFINKIFKAEANGKFSPVSLVRYDHYWTFSRDARHKYSILVELISSLANPATRASKLKNYSHDAITSIVPTEAVQNVIKYYKM